MSQSTDLVLGRHRTVGLPDADEAQRFWKLAHTVSNTKMVPGDFRGKPEAVLACMLAGREIGLGAMESLRSFYIVDGKPSESAELLHTLAARQGHDIWVVSADNRHCEVHGRHRDWPDDRPDLVVTWDAETAAIAGLIEWQCVEAWPRHQQGCSCKSNWRSYPRAMFRSRAITEAVRSVCPEVTVGATYSPEELGAKVEGPGGVPVDAPAGFGASGENFEVPTLEEFDAQWVASHTVDQVLAVVDHHGSDTDLGDVTLAEYVADCEAHGEARPRLQDGLDARMDVVVAEVVDDDQDDDRQDSVPDGGPPGGDDQQTGVSTDDEAGGGPPEGDSDDGPTVEEQLVADYTREELDDLADGLGLKGASSMPNKAAVAAGIVVARRAQRETHDDQDEPGAGEETGGGRTAAKDTRPAPTPDAEPDVELSVSQKALLKSIAIQSKALGFESDDDRHQLIRATTQWMSENVSQWEWGTLDSGTAVVSASPVAGKLLLAEGFHRVRQGPLVASYDGDGRLTLVDGREGDVA